MKAKIDAQEFKRIVNNTKKFTGNTFCNKMMQYIYLEVSENKIKATALEGHMVSVEYTKVMEMDEAFVCYIKPSIPKISKNDRYVYLELIDGKAFVTVGDTITGYVQPEGKYFDMEKILDTEMEKPTFTIGVNPRLLIDALKAAGNNGYTEYVKLELYNPKAPIFVSNVKDTDSLKMVLPVNISQ